MFDLISIGDAAVDHFFQIEDAHVMASLKYAEKQLCLNYGDKIPVEQYLQTLGGNNGNNAVGAARLALQTAVYAHIGDDLGGKKILENFKEEGVDTRYLAINKGRSSNISVLISFQGERTILVYHQDWHYSLPDLERTRFVYLSSMASSFVQSEVIKQLENYLERTGAFLVWNPGDYQLKYGVKKFPKLLSLTKLLVVNVQEARDILKVGGEKRMEIRKLLKELADLGPKMVVITDGKKGSYGFDGDKYYKLDVFPAEVVDMTGAGDSYATGVLAGLFYGKDLTEAMRWGAAGGASVVEKIGAQAGLLTYKEMLAKLKEYPKIVAKKI